MNTPVARVGARVITQYVLLRQIGCDLIESIVKLGGSFWNVNRAAALRSQLFHAPFSSERAQVCAFVQAGLDHVNLAIVGEYALDYLIEVGRVTRGLDSIRNDHQHAAAR